ncbi:MAG: hypothetical protein Q8R76_10385 [Candidatus Omnitrophota bacterium]|nr:hypothetical protein [Candidatus Omnitrophota bacterium]
MSQREYLITGIRDQKNKLERLSNVLESQSDIDPLNWQVYEYATREVESSLRKLRKMAAAEFIKCNYDNTGTVTQEECKE